MLHTQALQAYQQGTSPAGTGPEAAGGLAAAAQRAQVRVMVAHGDPSIRRMLSDYLGRNNMHVAAVSGKRDVASLLTSERFSMIVLDRRLDDENGLDLLRELRAGSDMPVIITAGDESDMVDRVVGLELGADDYVTQPFSPRELLARIRAVLRRAGSEAGEGDREPARDKAYAKLRFGPCTLDKRTRQLVNAQGKRISLTKGEYALLLAFLGAPQRPLSREQLLQATRVHEDVFDRSIDVQILRLRRKLQADAGMPNVIRTERGVGYVFALPVETV